MTTAAPRKKTAHSAPAPTAPAPSGPDAPARRGPLAWIAAHGRGLALTNLIAQGAIVATGGAVRLTNSGLACPTAPLCEPGSLFPTRAALDNAHTYVEFGNRLVSVVLITIAGLLAVAIWRSRPALRWWGLLPVVGVFAQAVLGAVSVHVKLNPLVIGAHMMISVALVWASMWLLLRYRDAPRRASGPSLNLARRASLALFAAVVVLGTITTGSGPHSGDPEATERLGIDPALAAKAHALAVWAFVAVVAYLAIVLWRRRAEVGGVGAGGGASSDGAARRAVAWLAAVTLAQGAIGYTQYALGLPILVVELHLIGIAALAAAHSAAFHLTRRA